CQWIHYYGMGSEDLKTVFNTFTSVFPHATLWGRDADLLLIGSKSKLSIDFQELAARMQEEDVLTDLRRVGMSDPYGVLGLYIMGDDALTAYCTGAPLHTDNHPILQFSAPKNLHFQHSLQVNIEGMEDYVESVYPYLVNVNDHEAEDRIQSHIDFRVYYNQSMIYAEQGNWPRVISEYQSALLTGANDSFIHRELGLLYNQQGEFESAVDHLQQAITLNPTRATDYVRLGDIFLELQQYEDAGHIYDVALDLVTTNAFIYFKRGYAYQELPEPDADQAIDHYNTAIELHSDYASAYANRAWSYYTKGDLTQATSDLNKAIDLDPNLADAYSYRGRIHYDLNDYDNAINDYLRSLAIKPTAGTHVNLGVAYSKVGNDLEINGRYKQADEYYLQAFYSFTSAITLKDSYVVAYLNRGQLLANTGVPEGAIEDFSMVINLEPENILAYLYRGLSYADLGNINSAMEDLNRIIAIAPDTAIAAQAQSIKDVLQE
ncbi:tetratricopeptide repeat protein, partial [Chloroflexota bacterium]